MTAVASWGDRIADEVTGVDKVDDVRRDGRPWSGATPGSNSIASAASSYRRSRCSRSQHSVRIEPSAPARAMPYIGLCGLLPVSLSERAGMTAPLMLASRTRRQACHDAATER